MAVCVPQVEEYTNIAKCYAGESIHIPSIQPFVDWNAAFEQQLVDLRQSTSLAMNKIYDKFQPKFQYIF